MGLAALEPPRRYGAAILSPHTTNTVGLTSFDPPYAAPPAVRLRAGILSSTEPPRWASLRSTHPTSFPPDDGRLAAPLTPGPSPGGRGENEVISDNRRNEWRKGLQRTSRY